MLPSCSVLVSEIEDVLVQILARLPIKSLKRFQCVSQRWRALIAEPHFVKEHNRYQLERGVADNDLQLLSSMEAPKSLGLESVMGLKDEDSSATIFNRSFVATSKHDFPLRMDDALEVRNYGACNGLICIEVNKRELVLWNPCTGSYNVLPQPSVRCEPRFYGFGYDSVNDDYKVVRGSHWEYDEHGGVSVEPILQIFSLKNSSWNTYPGLIYKTLLRGQGTLLDGVLHWLEFGDTACYRYSSSEIRPCSLAEEKFLEPISIPSAEIGLGLTDGIGGLLVHRNCLCAHTDAKTSGLRIYMMKEYGVRESWAALLKLTIYAVPELYNGTSTPLFIFENGDFLAYNEGRSGRFLSLYKQKDNAFKNVTKIDTNKFEGSIYRGTFVSAVTGSVADN